MWRAFTLFALLVASAAWAEGTTLTVSRQDCQRLVRHQPRDDVKYQPGVDVRGRKVRPAGEEERTKLDLPKEISFDIEYDIASKYGLSAQSLKAEPSLGKVTVKEGGRVYFNGKPLGNAETRAIEEACRKAYGGGR